jgi:hypothetical protein
MPFTSSPVTIERCVSPDGRKYRLTEEVVRVFPPVRAEQPDDDDRCSEDEDQENSARVEYHLDDVPDGRQRVHARRVDPGIVLRQGRDRYVPDQRRLDRPHKDLRAQIYQDRHGSLQDRSETAFHRVKVRGP